MSERTRPALAKLDELLPAIGRLDDTPDRARLLDELDALRVAVAAFHMEGIRFRMYSVDRLIAADGRAADARRLFDELRHALEAAGFHTRSHAAP